MIKNIKKDIEKYSIEFFHIYTDEKTPIFTFKCQGYIFVFAYIQTPLSWKLVSLLSVIRTNDLCQAVIEVFGNIL